VKFKWSGLPVILPLFAFFAASREMNSAPPLALASA
jgi:hypothetical protein